MSLTTPDLARISRVARVLRSVAANSDPAFFLSESFYEIADALEAILAHLTALPAETAPAPRPLAVGDRVEGISGNTGASPVQGIVRAVQAATEEHGRRVKIEWVGRPSLPYSEATARWWPASDVRRIDE